MALKLSTEVKGLTADYWKITDCNVVTGQVCMALFADKESATDLNGFSAEGIAIGGASNLTAQVAGVYRVDYMGIGSGQNNHVYLSTIMVNGVEKPECGHHHKMAAGGDVITQSGNCIITLAVGDDVGVSTQDMGGTGDGEYYGGNLNIVRVGN